MDATSKPRSTEGALPPALDKLPGPPAGKAGWPWTKASESLPEKMPSGQPWPKISIVTPSYNQADYLEKTLRSVLLQGYPNLEYIVIDGNSTDESVEIIERYAPWLDYWISEPDRGQGHAINKGFERATGDILAWLNSDDYYMPDALGYVAKEFSERSTEVGALVGFGYKVGEDGEVLYKPPVVEELNFETILDWHNSHFMQPSCFFRSEAWEAVGPLREDLSYCIDVDLWLKIAERFRFERVNRLLSLATLHEKAKTTEEMERSRVETALLVYDYGGDDTARRSLMQQAEQLSKLKRERRLITDSFLFKKVVRPVYHRLKEWGVVRSKRP